MLGKLTNLVHLKLLSQAFHGTLPNNLYKLDKLTYLNLGSKLAYQLANLGMGGSICENIKNLSNLKYLNLEYNLLNGTIPKGIGNQKIFYKSSTDVPFVFGCNFRASSACNGIRKMRFCFSGFRQRYTESMIWWPNTTK